MKGKRSPLARLVDMKTAVAGIAQHLEGRSINALEGDRLRLRAIERELEIISEASRHIPAELAARHPHIPWRKIADLGNIIRHAYQNVDVAVLRKILRDDLPVLDEAVQSMIRSLENEQE